VTSLWESLTRSGGPIPGAFLGAETSIALAALASGSSLSISVDALRGRSVLIATSDQLTAALALIELDGIARRIVLATPDVPRSHLEAVVAIAEVDTIAVDAGRAAEETIVDRHVRVEPMLRPASIDRHVTVPTEWVLLTSGTTGAPKPVLHTLESLAGALPRSSSTSGDTVWSTFYDIRRYGGLQIFLRAVLEGAPLVLSSPHEAPREFLARAGAAATSHISGTPSHWRRALMSGAAQLIAPRYVRLSGEIADQALLDNLRGAYPSARIAHAFASTEAGVAFDVTDGLAGFPAELVGDQRGPAALKVEDGVLRIRSARNATRYLGTAANSLLDPDGYVDTGDMVELRHGRYYFVGRKGGVINVGGLKVHPEEVEAVINADPRVRMSLVRARKNPITGAVVVAEVVLADAAPVSAASADAERLKTDLLAACRRALPAHKVPTMLRFVPALELTPAGKLVRPNA
jgi:acyl-coenzyme A synthetase/AMP-(fatty) acid ligase